MDQCSVQGRTASTEAVGAVPINEGYKSEACKVGDKCGRGVQVRLPRRPALHWQEAS